MADYIPGTCNIGKAEIQRRMRIAYIGSFLTALTAAVLVSQSVAGLLNALIFVPAVIASAGFLQARAKFCIAFGWAGIFNFGRATQGRASADGSVERVPDEFLAADREMARKLALKILLAAIAFTVLWVALRY